MAIQGDKTINAVCNKTKCFTPTMSKTDIENAIASAKTEIQGGTVANSQKVNNLEIMQDTNGVLKIGDIIIPQKKLLWEGEAPEGVGGSSSIDLSDEIGLDDVLECVVKMNVPIPDDSFRYTFIPFRVVLVRQTNAVLGGYKCVSSIVTGISNIEEFCYFIRLSYLNSGKLNFDECVRFNPSSRTGTEIPAKNLRLCKVYKIIE